MPELLGEHGEHRLFPASASYDCPVVIFLTCPACGATWRSQSVSGRTRCRHCRTRVYVPASVVRRAEDEPGCLAYDPATKRLVRVA